MTTLLIAAHPDDIEFGIGAALPYLTKRERVICACLTDGAYTDLSGKDARNGDTAILETRQALSLLGVEDLFVGNFKTKEIPFNSESVRFIEKIIVENAVDTVFVQWHGDHHQDHQAAHKSVIAAARRVPNVYGYNCNLVASANPFPFVPNRFLSVSVEDVAVQIEACQCHSTEWEKYNADGDLPSRIIANLRHYGAVCGVKYAVPLIVYREVL